MTRYFWLTARFPSEPGQPYRIELKPRFNRVAKRVKGMELWIDPDLFLPVYMKYTEPNGDYTEYRFEDLEVNPEIDSTRFTLELPADVEIE
jgi:outer membrane lipoprotein-sorting protein